jgi:uncharacterized membrane protein HdeD (DUF308 family)
MPMSLTGRPMLHALARRWWLLLLRGIAAIAFGILAFTWPGLTLVTLVVLYGAFAIADGVIALAAAFSGGAKPIPTWWHIIVGLLKHRGRYRDVHVARHQRDHAGAVHRRLGACPRHL